MIFHDLLFNLTLLIALSVVSGFVEQRWARQTLQGQVVQGCLFGGVAVLGMLHPVQVEPGLFFDGRSMILSLGALFYGPVTATLASLCTIGSRLAMGGMGMATGVLLVLSSSGIGLLVHRSLRGNTTSLTAWDLYRFGLLVHCAMLTMLFSLPLPRALDTLASIGLPVLMLYPLATLLAGKILLDQENRFRFLNEVRQTKEHLHTILHSLGEAVLSTDAHNRVLFMNPVAEALTGWTLAEAINKPLTEVVRMVDGQGGPVPREGSAGRAVLRCRDGAQYTITQHTAAIRDGHHDRAGTVLVFRDIGEEDRARQRLQRSELLFRNLFEHHAAVKLIIDPDTGDIIEANQAAELFYGWPKELLIQMNIAQINTLPLEDIQREINKAKHARRKYFAFRHRLADGSVRDVDVFNSNIEVAGRTLLHSIVHDVTSQKMAQEALQAKENYLRSIFRAAPVGIGVVRQRVFVTVNDHLCAMTGYTQAELTGQDARLLYPDEHEYLRVGVGKYRMIAQRGTGTMETQWVRKDGQCIDVLLGSTPFNPGDLGEGVTFTALDITETKQKAADLERLRVAIDQAGEIFIVTDPQGTVQYANPAFEQLTGHTLEDIVGQNPRVLKSGQHDAAFYQDLWATISKGKTWNGRLVNKRKDGSLYTEEATISPVFAPGGEIINYVAVKRDITAHLKLEQQFLQAQKMESVGRLTGGVAHDFNNILSVIIGYTEMALEQTEPSQKIHHNLRKILEAASRSADIVRQLLAFSRQQIIAPKVLNLNSTVEGMLNMLRPMLGEQIELIWRPAQGVPAITMDPVQVDQIVANLCINARDAIDGTGTIVIATQDVVVDEGNRAENDECAPGAYVRLSVSDTGCGIEKPLIDKIFEPFFTTKGVGHGTGLGLSTVYGIVKQNRGTIQVHSTPGQGTRFDIHLPAHHAQPARAARPASTDMAPGHQETVLLVEDDRAILTMVTTMLERLGYTVLASRLPEQALHLAREWTGKIDLLLTDVILPGMNGHALRQQLAGLHPQLNVLYMSGYTDNIIMPQEVVSAGVQFIHKPFTRSDLSVKLREALGKTVPADVSPARSL
ncbi:multi-sensor hybrid histidine kinase [Desulfobulbus propionicus DSM 2032]|uniref:histidine kinase n=2 Tax=Desulfobulbus propionicus TaxID=894 RepID=A0A7U4DP69_DESPD|nr:multi-sensor hybrid histidine kinase [Desulfobulbus propionicus DSM 2032]